MKRFYSILTLLAAFILITACTTQKKRGELKGLSKAYQNTTAKYNGYFNANELLQASILQLEEQHQDNYNKLLEMYKYIAADNPQAVAPNLDEAIKKVTIVVSLHRRSDWTDDCYLLVGESQFLKKEYESAEETFRYMSEEFSPYKVKKRSSSSRKSSSAGKSKNSKSKPESVRKSNDEDDGEKLSAKEQAKKRKAYNKQVKKNKKKKSSSKKKPSSKSTTPKTTPIEETTTTAVEEPKPETTDPGLISLTDGGSGASGDPDNYFLKHRPAYQEGQMWLAKTLVERDKFDEAFRILNQLDNDPKTFEDVRREVTALKAYYFIKRKDYTPAIAQLDKAIEVANKRATKARYAYIAAQLCQMQKNYEGAFSYFERVLKYGPEYEMEFSARLNMAQSEYRSGKGTAETAQRNLEKLLKDSKNLEYQDQIYYALAEIALREGNRDEGIRNLSLALKYSTQNRSQKAEAYLLLANLYYENQNYVPAKAYYDSTLQVLATTDERYDEVSRLSNSLTDIALHLETIQVQDSLLRISEMTDAQKRDLAARIKAEQDEARRKALATPPPTAGANDRVNLKNLPPSVVAAKAGGNKPALQKQSTFFAYDDKAVKRGKREFDRRWGVRRLEDDWRRSNRRTTTEETEVVAATEEINSGSLTDEDVKALLGNVPSTQGEKDEANRQIREAMFELGGLYRERLKNNDKAVEVLEELNRRYPANNYELDSWYLLYIIYTDMGKTDKAREYFNKIITKYPNTNYAKILQDPTYAAQLLDEEHRQAIQYDEIYGLFNKGNYRDAYDRSQKVMESLLGKHPLKPKYALLMAMCSGNLQGKETYISELQRVVAMYPETEEQKRAKEILRLLGASGAVLPGREKEEAGAYKVEANDLHYIIIVFNSDQVDLNAAKIAVSDYNSKYSKLETLRISNVFIGEGNRTPVLVMRRFKNQADAMTYYEGVRKNKKDFIDEKVGYELMAISQNNYRQLLGTKDVTAYKEFFDLNYR